MSYHKTQYNKNPTEARKPKTPKKISETYLHNSGLYYLERFSASKNHFKFVMKRKVKRSCMHHTEQDYDLCAQMVDTLADRFENSGLLDDNLYTNGLVASLRRKGLSRSAIINKMRVKGIETEKTIHALENLDNDNYENFNVAEEQAALTLAKKKRIGPFFTGEEQNIKKSLGIFARAGFSYQVAKATLDIDSDEIDNIFL